MLSRSALYINILALPCMVVIAIMAMISPARAQRLDKPTQPENNLAARGVVAATNRAILTSGLSSRITEVNFRNGQIFKKGDTLIRFSCKREKAQKDAAYAAYTRAKFNHGKNQELLSYNATGQFDVEIAKAEMQQALADYQGQQAIVDQCVLKAPYNGAVVANHIGLHETPQANQPLIEIVNRDQVEISMIISSSALKWLQQGAEFDFRVDDTGHTEQAVIDRIGAVVDPVSQTVEIIGIISNPSPALRPGMGGEGIFSLPLGG